MAAVKEDDRATANGGAVGELTPTTGDDPSVSRQSPGAGRGWVLLAVGIVLSLRLFYMFVYSDLSKDPSLNADAFDFVHIGWSLAHSGEYGRAKLDEAQMEALKHGTLPTLERPYQVRPDGWRPPVWTTVLAGAFALTKSVNGALIVRFALDALAVLLLASILTQSNFSTWACRTTLLLFALHPTWLLYSASLLSEPLTQLLLLSTVWLALRVRSLPSTTNALLLGGSAGILTLCHPVQLMVAALLVLVAVAPLPAALFSPSAWWVMRKPFAAAVCTMLLIVGAWVARNYIVLDHTGITTSSGSVLSMSWSETFLERYHNSTAEVDLERDPTIAENLSEHLLMVPLIIGRKLVGALGPWVEPSRPGILELGRALWWAIPFVPIWFVVFRRDVLSPPFRAIACACYGGYALMTVVTYPAIRFRAPLAWIDVLVTVAFVWWLAERLRKGRRRAA